VAYSVGRRLGGAVVRNRVRRRLRQIVAERAPHLVSGAYLIGVAPAAASLSFGDLRSIVGRALGPMTVDDMKPAERP
jgi:ribonuclease P protein component